MCTVMAVMPQAAEQRFHHQSAAQEIRPLVIHEFRCNNGGMLAMALLHELEKDVGLLGFSDLNTQARRSEKGHPAARGA